MKSEDADSLIYKLTNEVKNIIPKNDLIVTISNGNPVYLYQSNRKGWVTYTGAINKEYLDKIKEEGGSYIIGEKKEFKDYPGKLDLLIKNYENIVSNEEYFVIKL
jgi:hypothetical protein